MCMSAEELWFLLQDIVSRGKGREELFSVKSLAGFEVYFSNTLHLFAKFQSLSPWIKFSPLKQTLWVKGKGERKAEVTLFNLGNKKDSEEFGGLTV